jgi:hypothetical protein
MSNIDHEIREESTSIALPDRLVPTGSGKACGKEISVNGPEIEDGIKGLFRGQIVPNLRSSGYQARRES